MFDHVTVSRDFQLPITEQQQQQLDQHQDQAREWTRRFQTKSLDCLLDYYEIDKHGKLWILHDDGSRKLTNITTTMEFYDFITSNKLKTDLNITFQALIIQGVVNHIKLIEFSTTDNHNRVQARQAWIQSCEQAETRRKQLSWRLYNWLYARHVHWCLRLLHRVSGHVNTHALSSWRRRLLFWD